jgi:hypothetical protein
MVLWILAIEVMPNLHLATHDRMPHHHDASGAIVLDTPVDAPAISRHVHTHVFPYISRAEATALASGRAKKPPSRKRRSEHGWKAPLDHGDNSFAHRTAAVKSPDRAVTTPISVGFVATYVVCEKPGILYSIAAARPRARGPPTLTIA